ncbi:MAG: nucleotidyltransferase substrate binding protein [Elusimicrobiales bacterium]|nr:nucleotidyltransferase substrate binding protein [Elusimicrobiales bacterium]
MKLDFTSFEKAISSLRFALDFINSDEFNNFSEEKKNIIKAGAIQNFEFTYELSWKFIQRYLKENINKEIIEGLSRRELFKYAKEKKLIDDIVLWLTFHQARNETSHIYDQQKSDEIIKIAGKFLPEAEKLLFILKSKND